MLLNAMYLSLFCTMVGPQLLVAPELPLWASVVLVVLGVVPPIVTVRYLIPPAVHDLVIITGIEEFTDYETGPAPPAPSLARPSWCAQRTVFWWPFSVGAAVLSGDVPFVWPGQSRTPRGSCASSSPPPSSRPSRRSRARRRSSPPSRVRIFH